MAEAIVSLLLEKVAGFAQDEILKAATAKSEMEKLERRLKAIQPILRDAYNKQFLSEKVKDWVWRLNELSYDALDVIDLYRIKSRHGAAPHPSKVLKVLNSIANFAKKIFLHYKTGMKINKINARLKMLDEEKNQYDQPFMLNESSSVGNYSSIPRDERQTTSAITENKIIGREEDEAVVLKWLCEESSPHEDSASVIAIVAMGGVGKTALAKKIYHSSSVQQFFDKCMWVCVAEMPKLLDLFKKILEEVEEKGSFSTQLHTNANALCSKISDHLKKKKFLLVLDDVWELNWWEDVRGIWKDCGLGSKVLITTRQMEVAKAMGLAHLHELGCLNEEQSWQVLVKKALRRGESEKDFDGVLKDVGRDIARKCGGLPLALSVVGSMLQQKERRRSDWQDVLSSPLWNWQGPQNTNKVFASIALSFMSIPFQLKQCLTYCCMYPKDFQMEKEDLVRLWVAEGFILKNEGGVPMEVTAAKCLDSLVGCSLMQETKIGCYMLHDLVHDFALWMREKEYASMDQLKSGSVSHDARYISSFGGGFSLEALRGQEKLRGLICHEVDCHSTYNFAAFRWLRVLDLSRGNFSKLPESIGDLMLLKYINLSWTKVIELPESITKLHELQTLNLNYSDIMRLPSKISMLYSLRHLDIHGTALQYLPRGIGKLTCLQTLPRFVVGSTRISDKRGSSLSELRELNNLTGQLKIMHLERVSGLEEVDQAQLRRKENLHALGLYCGPIGFNESVIEKLEQVYEQMEPPIGIEDIKISSYPGRKCPTWMSSTAYSCLRDIFLTDCNFLESLPNLGFLPNLVDLVVLRVNKVKLFDSSSFDHVGRKRSFPKLESLRLEMMESLEEWQFDAEVENMPSLRQLHVIHCPKLRAMPFFSTLKQLTIQGMVEWEGWSMENKRVMSRLNEMNIASCEKLKLLPDCPKLENLWIDFCNELVELPHYPVLRSAIIRYCCMVSCSWVATSGLGELRHLQIVGCPKLQSLLQGIQDGRLETLMIDQCPSLTSIPAATALKRLVLWNLPQLQSLPATLDSGGLRELYLGNLPQFKSLPMTFLDGMKKLELVSLGAELGFNKVEELLARLEITKLRGLTLTGIQEMAGVEWFKSRIGYMVQLETLVIVDCPKLLMSIIDLLKEDSLPRLKFLQLATVFDNFPTIPLGGNTTCIFVIDSLQMSDKLAGLVRLSSRVTGLAVKVLPGLNSLPEWIQHFHQLKWLHIYQSPRLTSLPHWLSNLSQLFELELIDLPELVVVPAAAIQGLEELCVLSITSCPKLSSLPDELSALPRLGRLNISNCALLEEWCQTEDRCKIPRVYIQ